MSADIIQLDDHELQRLDILGARFDDQEKAENTRRLYASMWRQFEDWCDEHDLEALPADVDTVLRYVAHLGARAIAGEIVASTIDRKLAAIGHKHRGRGIDDDDNPARADVVRQRVRGIKRDEQVVTRPQQADGIMRADLRRMLCTLDSRSAGGLRDRALLTAGWFGACRRSELAALTVDQLQRAENGWVVEFGRTKTDQTGEEKQRAWLPRQQQARDLCPVGALERWLDRADIVAGPVFRSVDRWGNIGESPMSGRSVSRVIKRVAADAGLELDVSGHSLRRGATMQALANGATVAQVKMMGRWKTNEMALRYAELHELEQQSGSNMLAT
jgi:site-specific recombinase XerD